MTKAPEDRDEDRNTGEGGEHIRPEPLDPEKPAVGVEDVIEVFDREPPERPVTDSDAEPPAG